MHGCYRATKNVEDAATVLQAVSGHDRQESVERPTNQPELTFGSAQSKPLLFRALFARERCYLALETYFPYRNGRHKAGPALEEDTNRSLR